MSRETTYSGAASSAAVTQRFEAKYLISEMTAQRIRDHIQPFVIPDGHGQEYPVTSIYLDSPDLDLYLSSVRGEKRRYKLRIRTYTDGGEETCFFEVKHRFNQIICKDRAIVYNTAVASLLRGDAPTPDMLVNHEKDMRNLISFCRIRDAIDASPRVVVRYMREAYLSKTDEPLRVTFDRALTSLPSTRFDPEAWLASPHWNDGTGFPIVMEVKFTDTYPCWIGDLIQRLELQRESFAKYVVCVDALRKEGIRVSGMMEGFA